MEPDPDEHVHPGLETLEWQNDTLKGVKPTAKHSKLLEQSRKVMNQEKTCSMFCGGKKCKYCNYTPWSPSQMEIDGIYSNWVTDKILAMARPTTKADKEKKIFDKFDEAGIKAVLNLQMPGEHATCGEGLDKSGFSYDPQALMERGMFFYNFGWPDFGVAPCSTLLDISQVMQFALSSGKVAVHCHAGLGRTGLLIACYLVFTNRIKAGEAVQYVRSKRPNSIQTSEQVKTVFEFEEYLKPFRIIYASKDPAHHEVSLRQYLKRQQHILHGFEGKKLKFLPKIVYMCCERLLELASKGNSLQKTRSTLSMSSVQSDLLRRTMSAQSFARADSQMTITSNGHLAPFDSAHNKSLESLQEGPDVKDTDEDTKTDGKHDKNGANEEDVRNEDNKDIVNGAKAHKSEKGSKKNGSKNSSPRENGNGKNDSKSPSPRESKNTKTEQKNDKKSSPRYSDDRKDDTNSDKVKTSPRNSDDGKNTHKTDSERTSSSDSEHPRFDLDNGSVQGSVDSMETDFSRITMSAASHSSSPESPSQVIIEALIETDYGDLRLERVDGLETAFNETDEAWSVLAHEQDPVAVALLMWNWLDQLNEPVLSAQDLTALLSNDEDPLTSLLKVEKAQKQLLEYLARVIIKLRPTSDMEQSLLERLLSHLTHQVVRREVLSQPSPESMDNWPNMRSKTVKQLLRFFRLLVRSLKHKEKERQRDLETSKDSK